MASRSCFLSLISVTHFFAFDVDLTGEYTDYIRHLKQLVHCSWFTILSIRASNAMLPIGAFLGEPSSKYRIHIKMTPEICIGDTCI